MDKFRNILLFIVMFLEHVHCQDFELRDSAAGCKLATPNITYTTEGNFIDLPANIADAIVDGERVRVGYLKTFRAFQYIGCVWHRAIPGGTKTKEIVSDPGQCYSFCKSDYFAIHETKCFCLMERKQDTSTRCTTSCTFPKHTPCGGYRSGEYASVYKHVTTTDRGNDDGLYCRAYNTVRKTFEWGNCGFGLNGLCRTGSSDIFTMTYSDRHWINSDPNWITYSKYCFEEDSYPASETESLVGNPNQWIIWIGTIKSWVVEKETDSDDVDVNLNYKGYIMKIKKSFKMDFNKDDNPTSWRYLCLKEKLTPISSTVVTQPSEPTPYTSHSTTQKEHSTLFELSSTTVNIDSITDSHNQKIYQQECKELIAVYIVVPFSLIVCVVLLVLFVITKRRNNALGERLNKDQNIQSRKSQDIINALENKAYDEGSEPKKEDQSAYIILEPSSEHGYTNNIHSFDTAESNTQNVYDGDYDTTPSAKRQPKENNDNIYNKLCEDSFDTYSHSNDTREHNMFSSDDDTYNHVRQSENVLNDTYNTLNGVIGKHDSEFPSENVYANTKRR